MRPRFTMRRTLHDPKLLGNVLTGPSWLPHRTLLIAGMGEPLTVEERVLFRQFTQRDREPERPVEELWLIVGRRGGKTRAMSVLATYLAGCCDYKDVLVPGERGIVLCLAPDQDVAAIIIDHAAEMFAESPILRQMVRRTTADTIELTNKLSIEVRWANWRRLRGPTYCAVLADELAFWIDNETSSNPADEILAAIRPGLATTSGPLIAASSPHGKSGELYDAFRLHYGAQGDPAILVAKGTTREFNVTFSQAVVDRALLRDPAKNRAEYLAEFRDDISAFLGRKVVESCVSPGTYERAPDGYLSYAAFCDPANGAPTGDPMTLCIAHRQYGENNVIVDLLREVRPPFSPDEVIAEFAHCLKAYRCERVLADRVGGVWLKDAFSKVNIKLDATAPIKNELYANLLPALNSGQVALLDNQRLIDQLCNLERTTVKGGRDRIDHPPGAHDDLANSLAGAVTSLLGGSYGYNWQNLAADRGTPEWEAEQRAWRASQYWGRFPIQ
jgi:hypothetical protein